MTPPLLPCPFCGRTKTVRVFSHHFFRGEANGREKIWWGSCDIDSGGCGAHGPERCSDIEARDAWNRRATPWQPIETAPRDGTQILAFGLHGSAEQFVICWDAYARNPDHPWATPENLYYAVGAFTHWMPLPAPPEATP